MAPTTPQPAPPPAVPPDSDPVRAMLSSLLRVLDVVFGTISFALAGLGVWWFMAGKAHLTTLLALWAVPLLNLVWSLATNRARNRVLAELGRGALTLPVAVFLYVADAGLLEKLWIPALMMTVGISLSTGIASRRSWPGYITTLAYGGALLAAAAIHFGRCDLATINDVFGICMTGFVLSLVAGKLGRTLDDAGSQRDAAREQKDLAEAVLLQLTQRSQELTVAIENLHNEMAHRMRVELELRQAQKLESVGRLASGVAHEINTPVQFVSDSLQFVRDGVADLFDVVHALELVQRSVLDGGAAREAAMMAAGTTDTVDMAYLSENVPKALDRALDGLSRVSTIVRSMKEFAHPDSKDMAAADLNHAIASTLTMARNEYLHVADLETEYGELPPVRCYIGELNQAVLNIVVNAAHAIGDAVAGGAAKGRIRVRTYRDGDDAIVAISDTGAGIPIEIRDRIYDQFFTTKAIGRGTGQGLAVTRSVIVDKHRGHLDFETELGKGTTFIIRLPIDGHLADAAPSAAALGPGIGAPVARAVPAHA